MGAFQRTQSQSRNRLSQEARTKRTSSRRSSPAAASIDICLPRSSYQIQAVPRGHVVALHGRSVGVNGLFRTGDVGSARYTLDGRVRIVWSNGSRSLTEWPNPAWYRGYPLAYDDSFIYDDEDTQLPDSECPDLEQCSFHEDDDDFPYVDQDWSCNRNGFTERPISSSSNRASSYRAAG